MSQISRNGRLNWLLLPVETKHRELDAKLWQACCAVERGYGVILGDMEDIHEQYLALPRGICLDKAITPAKGKVLRRMHRAGYRLCVNDEEALFAYNQPQRYLETRMNRATLGITDYYFTWGERQAELIRGAYPEYKVRVHAVGSPRVDLLISEMRSLYARDAEHIRDRLGRYILLPSNFCDILHINGPDYRLEQARAAGQVRTSDDVRQYHERRQYRERVLDAFVEALEAIRERFPSHALVVRPHPADDSSHWLHRVAHVDRCHVLHEGTAIPWLLGADVIFHNGCTTAVEAFLLGKTPISYHPLWDDRFEYNFQSRVGPAVDDIEALLATIHDVIADGTAEARNDSPDLGEYIRMTPQHPAAEATLDLLATLESRPRRLEYSWINPNYVRHRVLVAGKRMERWIRRKRRGQSTAREPNFLRLQKWPNTTLSEIEARLVQLRACSGRFFDVEVAHLTGHLFVLRPAGHPEHTR